MTMEIGEPIKRWTVIPLSEPVPAGPEPTPPAAPAPEKERVKEDA